MANDKKKCPKVSIPTTDESLEDCDGFVLSKCVMEGEKTQEEINADVKQKLDDLEEMLHTILNLINSETP